MTVNEKLLARLRAVGLKLPPDTEIRQTYAGAVQRKQDAWSWFAYCPSDAQIDVGSHWQVSELVRHQWLLVLRSETGALEVDPLVAPVSMAGGHAVKVLAVA